MLYSVVKSKTIIPEWNGNKKLPKAAQITVDLQFPSFKELSKISEENPDAPFSLISFLGHVKKVNNLKLEKDGKKVDATPIDLYETEGLVELLVEVKAAYDELTKVDKKK
jgi:hypothetical protein